MLTIPIVFTPPKSIAQLLEQYWDAVLEATVVQNKYSLVNNFLAKYDIDNMYPDVPVDRVVRHRIENRRHPLLLIGICTEPLTSYQPHCLETRLSAIMTAALAFQIILVREKPIKVASELKIFGLLVSGQEFEICVMYPLIHKLSKTEFRVDYLFQVA